MTSLTTTAAAPGGRAAVRCHYAADPVLRPDCALTAEIRFGTVALCGPCAAARSTLGKGAAAVPLPPGPALDVLDWVAGADAAARRARADLAAAVTRARSRGCTWTQIARLGITRQAACQRFGESAPPPAATRSPRTQMTPA